MKLEESKEERSVQDIMFEGLDAKHKKVFHIHKNIWGFIHTEWRNLDKKIFIPKAVKRTFLMNKTLYTGINLQNNKFLSPKLLAGPLFLLRIHCAVGPHG